LLLTIPQFVSRTLKQFPDRPAIRNTRAKPQEPDEVTFRELDRLSTRLAVGLAGMGISKGDRVAIMARPRIRFAAALLAIVRLGALVVPIDPTLTATETADILKRSGARAVFAPTRLFDRLSAEGVARISFDDDVNEISFSSLLLDGGLPNVEITQDDTAILAYTSGTTGGAKGVLLTHGNISADIEGCINAMPITEQDTFLTIAPWHHILGLTTALLLPIYTGALTMYTDDYRSIAQLMKEHRVTIFTGVPKLYHAMYEKLIAQISTRLIGRVMLAVAPRVVGAKIKQTLTDGQLRFLVSGSAPLDPGVALGFRRLGIGLLEGYGLTETSPVVCFCNPFSRKGGSVGAPITGARVKLIDVRPDGVGELLVQGPIVMRGYYANGGATAAVIDKEGWFHTGDLAMIDEDGDIHLKGRAKHVIVLESGKNVYPEEVEWELSRIPYVEEVLVRGGKLNGQEVVQAVIYPNAEALEESGRAADVSRLIWEAIKVRQGRLAPHKRIRRREDVIITDQPFPKTSTMDIKRHLYKGGNDVSDDQ
jgi:long-chain acyl-CoA synthetase